MRPNRYSLPPFIALLALALALPAQAQYGSGINLQVPQATGPITLDGVASEADWDKATEVDMTQHWDSGWFDCCGEPGVPDIAVTTKLLWDDGALYVFIHSTDFTDFFFGEPGSPNNGEHWLVGVDLAHEDSDTPDPNFSGWPDNLPNLGPVAYKITGALGDGSGGITANFGFDGIDPVAEGYVDGHVFVDNDNYEWGVEMVIFGAEVAMGAQIGFNVGGANASPESAAEAGGGEEANYAYFSWLICDPVPPGGDRFCQYPGGTVMSDAGSFATLNLVDVIAIEPGGTVAPGYALTTSGPNPFRASTAFTYALPHNGQVELALFDVLGRQVAALDSGVRAAGEHRAAFDAATLPVGVYTARLVVDGAVVATRRVTHAR